MNDFPLLSLITFTPLAGAVAVGLLPDNRPDLIRRTALAFALLAWVFSIGLVFSFAFGTSAGPTAVLQTLGPNAQLPSFRYVEVADWIPNFGIQYKLGADGLSVLLVLLTTTLSWISILASGPIQNRLRAYMISFLVLEVGMIGVFVALDLFLFYIFWEIVLVPMYLIIGIWGGANRIYATMKFVLYTLVGSLLMLVAILATAFAYQSDHNGSWVGAFDYQTLAAWAASTGFAHELQAGAFLALFLAFAIKVPMWPFHTWLPDAHTEAPTAGSVILAGVMLKLGAYGLIRFAVPLYPWAAHTFAWPIIVMSVIAIVYGAIVSIVQPDLKRLVAYSSVSHMGFVTLGIFVFTSAGLQGAILQMINHGLITGGLFLLVGVVYERTHDRTIAKMGGLAAAMPIWSTVFGFFILASAGLPGLSGFVGEFLVFVGSFTYAPVISVSAIIVMVFAATYLLWMFQRVGFNELSDFLRGLGGHLTDMSPVEGVTLLPLGIGIVVLGLFPSLALDFLRGPTQAFMAAVGLPIAG
jgi:NADH-quinone oxidoreductase subunit M